MLPLLLILAGLVVLATRRGGVPSFGEVVTLLGGAKVVEAWSNGVSLGYIQVHPFASDASGRAYYLREDAAQSAKRLLALADAQRMPLVTESAFRFMEEQLKLWSDAMTGLLSTPVARPGYSKHQSGVAWDVAVARSNTSPAYRWLAEFGPAHGWVNVGAKFSTPEYWHWEYQPDLDRYT